MKQIGKIILKGILNNLWIKIEYKNMNNENTRFMIGVKDINASQKKLIVDSFNITYNYDTEVRNIFFDAILDAEICENTYYNTPQSIINKIKYCPEEYNFLNGDFKREDIIDYYCDCFKLDKVPYKSEYSLIPGIDDDVITKNDEYLLNSEQFENFAKSIFFKKDKKNKKNLNIENNLVMNVLSIKSDKGLYVLCYRDLNLSIKDKKLVAQKNIMVNKEFAFDAKSLDTQNKESYTKYLSEEDYILFDNVKENLEKIKKAISNYCNNSVSTYKREVRIDTCPYIITLSKNHVIDINSQLDAIKQIAYDEKEGSLPIRTFFGENVKLSRRNSYPIFVVDEKYNIDQINAIDKGMKSPVSYIQGPPGTGKTKTILNAVVTASFNGKTVLVSSNNNIPMDGVANEIFNLKYRSDIPLLFPAIRLGNYENIDAAIDRIKEMADEASYLSVYDELLKSIIATRKESMKELVSLLERYEKYTDLANRNEALKKMLNCSQNEMFKITINGQIEKINEQIKQIGSIDLDDLTKYMDINTYELFMAIHYKTAERMQNFSEKSRYDELRSIIYMDCNNDETKKERNKCFKDYLSIDENMSIFQEIFPVIISTNLSCSYLGSPSPQFDIVMIDEAGQCNIANALIPIVRAKQLILVGDPQQLKPVILLDPTVNKMLKDKYNIPEEYDYANNSIYTAYTQIDIINKETLLSFHYRCNDKIIGFSNKKYYNEKLKLKSQSTEKTPLLFYDTSSEEKKDRTSQKNISRTEASFICNYIKEHQGEEIGIITPFVRQKECIETFFSDNHIENISIGTVHAFQGEEKKTIIFSTAITPRTLSGTYNWLKNNKELINVAVSRPIDKLIVLGSKEAINELSDGKDDLKELFDYVDKNGISKVTNVSFPSYALGTKQLSTDSEKEFNKTITQALSIIDANCYTRAETQLSKIFEREGNEDIDYFMQSIDLVVFQRAYGGDRIVAAFELNGPEHLSDENTKIRDAKKKKYCEEKGLKIYTIAREWARDYQQVKSILCDLLK